MSDDNIQHGIDDNPEGDAAKGAALGGVGGAAVGAAAGALAGPPGMLIGAAVGAIAGAVASGAAVAVVDSMDNDDTVTGIGHGATRDAENVLDDTKDRIEDTVIPTTSAQGSDAHLLTAQGGDTTMATSRSGNTPLNTDLDNDLNVSTTASTTSAHLNQEGQTTIPIVEEELQVGKREVQGGGVRVTSNVTEVPVQEQVTLREEHVTVDRHAVDRPATDADFRAAQGATLEVTETAEEAVVAKQARVVEEIVVGKESTQHTETIQDTVRHTDVNIEQLEADFRANHQATYGAQGASYDQYAPAYRHGYELANDQRHANSDWDAVEPHARTNWSNQNSGNWDDMKDAVRYGYDRVKGRR